jgi:DNA-binding XRE family transcriptional regulator
MTHPPDSTNPAKEIRKALGLSQWRMGELLGVSRDAIEKVENRRMSMPRDLAYRYRAKTGCDIREGGEAKGEGPIEIMATFLGEPYTKSAYEAFRASFQDPEYLDNLKEMMQNQIQVVIKRAAEEKKVMEFIGDFCEFLSETIRRHELGDDLDKLFTNPYAVMRRK